MVAQSHILRLREYESASIGPVWDATRKVIPPGVVAEIERLQAELGAGYLEVSRRYVKAQNYVGVIGVGDRCIEVLPKTDDTDDAARRRLLEMMSLGGTLPHLEVGIADLAESAPCLLDVFMQAFTRQLALEWRRGRICSYQKTDENRTHLRGKLLFHQQLCSNRNRPERFFTRADQFITDVPPSRLLKCGLDVCLLHGMADKTRRTANTLIAEFEDVSSWGFTDVELDAIEPDRRIERFAPLLTMAKHLVRGRVADRPGGAATFSLMFDMNEVFEKFVGCLLRSACPVPYRAYLQSSGRSLAVRDGKPKFQLRPDVVVRHGPHFSLLVDTKWKLLDATKSHEGVRQSDMYQAYAYAREFTCPHVILLYPRFGDLGGEVATYQLSPGEESSSRITIRTVDVAQPAKIVRAELQLLVAEALSL